MARAQKDRTVTLPSCFYERFRIVLASRDGLAAAAREIGVSYDHLNKVARRQVRPSALLFAGLRGWLGDEALDFCWGISNQLTVPPPAEAPPEKTKAPRNAGNVARGRGDHAQNRDDVQPPKQQRSQK